MVHLADPQTPAAADISLLDAAERSRADNFRFTCDRELYIAAHAFLRQTLSRHAPAVMPGEWRFAANAYGKPFISNPSYGHLQFNLSHTKGLIACAVSNGKPVGIDVEQCKPLEDIESLCRYAFSPRESADVLALPVGEQQMQRFFTYWTLKEAYLKARGMGLSLPLQQFSMQQGDDGQWCVHGSLTITEQDTNWQFLSQPIGNRHYLALVVERLKLILANRILIS